MEKAIADKKILELQDEMDRLMQILRHSDDKAECEAAAKRAAQIPTAILKARVFDE